MKRNEADLGNQSVGRLLFRLALPAITAQLINVLYNIVDRMYIGHIPVTGTDALTGVGVTMPAIMAISAFAALVSMGGAPRASIMMGRGDNGQAERVLGNCTTMLVIMASVLTAVFLIFGRQILMVFGASGNHRLCVGLYADIRRRHRVRSACPWPQRVYFCPGLREDKHVYRTHRRCMQHNS